MHKLTLQNTFHGTKCVILAEEGISPYAAYQDLMAQAYGCMDSDTQRKARRKLARINKALCGMSDCKCGIPLHSLVCCRIFSMDTPGHVDFFDRKYGYMGATKMTHYYGDGAMTGKRENGKNILRRRNRSAESFEGKIKFI